MPLTRHSAATISSPDHTNTAGASLSAANVAWALSTFSAIRLEANWVQKGGKGTTTEGNHTADMVLNYLEAPLLLTLGTALSPTVVLGAHGGIAWGYQLNCNVAVDGGSSQSCLASDITLDAKRAAWSVPLGVTFGVNLGGSTLFIDGRYSLGLTNLTRVPDTELAAQGFQGIARLGFPFR